jgi:lysophospholipase L1-like esterase
MFHFFTLYILIIGQLVMTALAAASVPTFQQNDRVVFIGDSITHGGRYHSDVYLFYATRFPNQPFAAYNCGISGDTAPGTNIRFKSDIASHKPNVATIMLGMNDAWAPIFDTTRPRSVRLNEEANAYSQYTKAMDQLVTNLTAIDCQVVLIKPSIYDQTAEIDKERLIGKNDLLQRFSNYIDTLAQKYNTTVVDFHTPMGVINHAVQAANPSDTIISKDRVHPGIPGHLVMAYHFLKSQNMPQYVSAIRLDAAGGGKILQQLNCQVHGRIEITPNTVNFAATEQALPFPISNAQLKALDWVPFQHELNRQVLSVDNLASGRYELTIDATKVGQYTSEALKSGIDLNANQATPQYKQALQVKAFQDKQLQATAKLRSIAFIRHSMLRKIEPSVSEVDHTALTTALLAHVEKSADKPWHAYLKQEAENFLKIVPMEAEYKRQEVHWMKQMWNTNQPITHNWKLQKID